MSIKYFFFDLVDKEISFDILLLNQFSEGSPDWSIIFDLFYLEVKPFFALLKHAPDCLHFC